MNFEAQHGSLSDAIDLVTQAPYNALLFLVAAQNNARFLEGFCVFSTFGDFGVPEYER